MNKLFYFLLGLGLISCKQGAQEKHVVQDSVKLPRQTELTVADAEKKSEEVVLHDTAIVNLVRLSDGFVYDMRYASEQNFLNTAVYDCANCKLRKEVADALIKANAWFGEKGYRIKFFDCYRPIAVQKQMWEVMPDGRYVANPYKSGSIHNRGGAVDLSLVALADGKELDMGTDFDHFGQESHHSYADLPKEILENRKLLRRGMESAGFQALETEWWHYLYGEKSRYRLANVALCDE